MTNEEQRQFSIAQWKFIIYGMIVVMVFYITSKTIAMAQVEMLEEGVISKYALGMIITVSGILHGLSRFVNSFWADRLNGRIFMTIGLGFIALMTFLFGCTSTTILFAAFWFINAWARGIGVPASARMLTHWIHPKELATKMAIWNTSPTVGVVLALGLCSLLLGPLGLHWRWCFWLPGLGAAATAVFCFFYVKESPTEAGVHELELDEYITHKSSSEVTNSERIHLVFGNKIIWLVVIANIFVHIVRFGFCDWGPTFLKQFRGIPVATGGIIIILFEIVGMAGTLLGGWITDKVFKGRGVRTCAICMFFTALFSFGFWMLPNGGTELRYIVDPSNPPNLKEVKESLKEFDKNLIAKYQPQKNMEFHLVLHTIYTNSREDKKIEDYKSIETYISTKLCNKFTESNIILQTQHESAPTPLPIVAMFLVGAGFFLSGSQSLVGSIVVNQATKEASAMAIGFSGIMGWSASIVSGIGFAFIEHHYGWSTAIWSISCFALIGMIPLVLAWNANATGYKTKKEIEK